MWPRQNNARTWTPGAYYKGRFNPFKITKTEYLRECSATQVWPYMHQLRIIVFGQMLGLPGSYVLVPYVPLYRLGSTRRTTVIVPRFSWVKHLSGES